MNSAERLENCFECKPISDRSEIPVFPMLISYPGKFAGITQKEMVDDPGKWMEALKKTYDHFGYPDLSMPLPLGDVIFAEGLEARRPGYELPDDAQFQVIEKCRMGHDDYREILAKGWGKWNSRFIRSVQNPPIKTGFGLISRYIKLGGNANKVADFLRGLGVEPISGTAMSPLFDAMSMIRSFEEFCMDLYDVPGLVHDVLNKESPALAAATIKNAGRSKVKRIQMFAMRSDANSISPALFDEFSYPCLKQNILEFNRAGYRSVLHADGNWIPMLDRFLDLPKHSVHFEFDGLTDLEKASEILGGWHSMRGDVPATMLAFGAADEVGEYCEKLVSGVGMKGGFVLGSGCEVPMNCKPECLMAFMKAVPRPQ
ncbi:MAG: hypothetical protein FWG03_06800 [Clostridiales bacterium]|nr:hypothetical protein [Clostridiales bacterium]